MGAALRRPDIARKIGRIMMDRGNRPLLFEIAWEVCRQVGGIYTVLRSKAPFMVERYQDRYCLIGPFTPQTSPMEFEQREPGDVLGPTIERLRDRGMQVRFGRWLIAGYPKVLLFDYLAHFDRLAGYRQALWEEHNIPSPAEDSETNDAIVFGHLVAEFFEELIRNQPPGRRIIAHFHEWMASVGLSVMKRRRVPIAGVFTTHATILGRYLCSGQTDFYERLPRIDVDIESGRRGIYQRYCIERAAAHCADVFTTVSKVTGDEATYLLKRSPDVILPNGLRVERFAALHEFQNLHRHCKEKIQDFVRAHFFGAYDFDLDETIYMFTSGRFEYRNKGMDHFIEALYRLNRMLQEYGGKRHVVAFIITNAATKNMHPGVLKAHFMFEEMRRTCDEITASVGHRIFEAAARGKLPGEEGPLLKDNEIVRLKRMIYSRKHEGQPTIVTHDMWHDDTDAVLSHLRHRRLFNAKEDRVKVVYHPEFLISTNPLFGMDYDQFVRGCHLGVFPSYYEPWGYTPAECTVLGIPSVCSDLSGFGAFVQEHIEDHENHGLFVIERSRLGDGAAIDQLSQLLFDFCLLNRRDRIELRNATERISDTLDWAVLGRYYLQAHEMAIERAYQGLMQEAAIEAS